MVHDQQGVGVAERARVPGPRTARSTEVLEPIRRRRRRAWPPPTRSVGHGTPSGCGGSGTRRSVTGGTLLREGFARTACHPGPVLQARNLRIEAGGTTLLDGVSFTVRARDKVGLVGRNGAGKTTLLKVLGGAARRPAGVVHRTGGLGYLPQDPRLDGVPDDVTALTHVLSGPRPRRGRRPHREAAAGHGGGPVRAQPRPLHPGRGAVPASTAATRPRARSAASPPASAWPTTASTCRSARCRAASGAGSSWRASSSPAATLLLLDEPTNHLDTDAKDWLLGFLRGLPRRPARDQPRPRPARRGHHPRAPPRPGRPTRTIGTMVEYKGTYSQYLAQREPRTRSAWPSRPPRRPRRSTGCRPSSTASAPRPRRRRWPTASRSGSTASRPAGSRARARRGRCELRFPEPPPAAAARCSRSTDLAKAYGDHDVFEDLDLRRRPGRAPLVMGLNGAGKTSLLRILAGVHRGRRRRRSRSGIGVSVGYYAQEHEGIDAGPHAARPHARPSSHGLDETELRGAARHVRPHRRQGVPGRRHALGRREDEARARPARRRPAQPAAARRADQQPRPGVARGDRARARPTGRAR